MRREDEDGGREEGSEAKMEDKAEQSFFLEERASNVHVGGGGWIDYHFPVS